MTERPLRVAVDATSLLDPPTGVGVVVRELLDGFAERPDLDVSTFAVSWRGRRRLPSVVGPAVAVRSRPFPARLARRLWLRGDHPSGRGLGGADAEVIFGPNHVVPPGGGAAEVLTIHDLTAVRYPELATADVLQWPPLARRAARRGAWVHTPSEAVAAEVRAWEPAFADRVVAVPNGVRRPPAPTPTSGAAEGRRLAGTERYVLAVGTVEPRKDLPTLVRAWDALAADDPDLGLVIAGPDGWGVDGLTAARDGASHRRRIRRLGWVGGDQRLALLRGAAVLAYPSVYEGFGLVPLEALAAGTPVVTTDIAVHREVLTDAAPLVPVGDPDALAAALHRVVTDDDHAAAIVAAGQARVDAHPWSATVAGVADLLQRAASR